MPQPVPGLQGCMCTVWVSTTRTAAGCALWSRVYVTWSTSHPARTLGLKPLLRLTPSFPWAFTEEALVLVLNGAGDGQAVGFMQSKESKPRTSAFPCTLRASPLVPAVLRLAGKRPMGKPTLHEGL